MDDIKKYVALFFSVLAAFTLINSYWYHTNNILKVKNNPDVLPEVIEDTIDKEIVEPLLRQVNLITLIANIIAALPPELLLIGIIAYAFFFKK
jgi:hypothetical protein